MLKMNTGAWIGIGAGIAGILIAIIAVITTMGSSGIYITLGICALFGGMGFLFYKLFFGPMINAARLQKNGLPGKAKILDVKDTGVTINNNPQVKLILEVKNNFGQVYNAESRVLVSRINPNAYMPGMEIPVKIDPKNEKNVVIDFSAGRPSASFASASIAQPNAAALQAELEQLQKDNDAISQSGKPARAIIKKYTWLGAYVNGNNPYVELEMEVLPENMASFSSKAKGVISEASVNKFQPGSEISVKYDFYDNSKIVIDHS